MPESQTYFHCAPVRLGVGSIIEPGNFGRVLSHYEWNPTNFSLNIWREALLEQARKLYAPDKPSRLKCIFALFSLEDAVAFRNKWCPTNIIHEVQPISENPGTHIGNYDLAS